MPSVGERIRTMCEELGPTFVKLGQILSTRTDIVTENVAQQLQKLQDSVQPFSYEEARSVIESELGDSIERLFERFDPVPVASASVSQVYRAKMFSGPDIAVKVQRPHIRENIETDLGILEKLARLVDKYSKYGQLYDFSGMVAEFRRVMEQEIDFTKEGENTDLFRESIAKQRNIRVPKIHWVYTTKKILTMDYVDGVKINDIPALTAQGADTTQLAYDFTNSLITQILQNGVFHADPHPGNVFVADGRYVEFIDLGMVGTINSRFRRCLNDFVLGIATRNTQKIAQSITEMDAADADINMDSFGKSLEVLLDEYLYVPLRDVNIAKVFSSVFSLAVKYKMKIPREFTLVAKCLGTAQGIIEELDPSTNILGIAEKMVRSILANRYKTDEFKNEMQSYALDWLEVGKKAPSALLALLHKLKKNDYAVELKIHDLHSVEKNIERMFNRISFAVVLLAVCIVMAGVIISAGYSNFGRPEAEVMNLSTVAIVAGLLISAVIVIGILVSMVRSGREKKK